MKTMFTTRRLCCVAVLCALASYAQAQAVKLTLAHGNPPDNPRHVAAVKFADTVKAKTNGRIEIQVAHSAQLGDDAAMVTALRSGTLDISANSQGAMSNVVPEYSALGLPFRTEYAAFHGCDPEALELRRRGNERIVGACRLRLP